MHPVIAAAIIGAIGATVAAVMGAVVTTRRKAEAAPAKIPHLVGTKPQVSGAADPLVASHTARPTPRATQPHDPAHSLVETPKATRTYAEGGDDLDAALISDIQVHADGDGVTIWRHGG